MNQYRAIINQPFVMSGGLFLTQPWLDTEFLGCQACVFFEGENYRKWCEDAAQGLLDTIWQKRQSFTLDIPDIDAALAQALILPKPCCLVDLGDILSAGGTGDSTVVLRALLRAQTTLPSCLFIVDPGLVRQAMAVGSGNTGTFFVGSGENVCNQKVEVQAEVDRINPEPYRNLGETLKGVLVNAGIRVWLQCGPIAIIASEHTSMNHDRNALLSMGIDPASMAIIVQKTHQMFKAGYDGIMASFIYADTPGYTDRNFKRLPYKKFKFQS
jgi:microcystin degradation protein MlrC